jgi:hypothetical protein
MDMDKNILSKFGIIMCCKTFVIWLDCISDFKHQNLLNTLLLIVSEKYSYKSSYQGSSFSRFVFIKVSFSKAKRKGSKSKVNSRKMLNIFSYKFSMWLYWCYHFFWVRDFLFDLFEYYLVQDIGDFIELWSSIFWGWISIIGLLVFLFDLLDYF